MNNKCVMFVGYTFKKIVGISNHIFLPSRNLSLFEMFHYSYEAAEYIQEILKENKKKLARFCNFTIHYIYNLWWPCWSYHKIKNYTDTASSASHMDLHL